MKKKSLVHSVPQRKLMGYAYACATGKAEDCPPSIEKVAKSFTKKKGGLAKLRKRASVKHTGLSVTRISEERILKFEEFKMMEEFIFDENNDDQSAEVIEFLYSLKIIDLTATVNEFIQARNAEEKMEYIQDIMNILKKNTKKKKELTTEKLSWIESNIKKRI